MQHQKPEPDATAAPRRGRGGRPKNEPGTVRDMTIGVRVSRSEFEALKVKAEAMSVTPAQWLRQAALSRRLPAPPVPAINRGEYADLARLSANLNQLARAGNEGRNVVINDSLIENLRAEVNQLRLALIGMKGSE
ncbi:hypothetical protein RCH14_004841 [Massilia sp. MP_M2]|jgi:hypothetical protein|uniref:plasmid mobilization protein n=1 Tax=Massilia sp. MP_M2 TaxID=3071713 RepID=UPI00319DAE99